MKEKKCKVWFFLYSFEAPLEGYIWSSKIIQKKWELIKDEVNKKRRK